MSHDDPRTAVSEPQDEQAIEAVLQKRAERLARRTDSAALRVELGRVVVVAVGERRVGLPVEHLRAIVRAGPTSALPGLPSTLLGVTQIRGELISVVDLRRWLGAKAAERDGFFAILQSAEGPLALLVDQVLGFLTVHEDEVARTVESDDERGLVAYVTEDLVAVLSAERIFAQHDVRFDARARRATTLRSAG